MSYSPTSISPAKVQQVSKVSSDELLRKFAALDEHPAPTSGKVSRARPSLYMNRSSKNPSGIHESNENLSDGGCRMGGRAVRKIGKRKRSLGCQAVVECKALLPGSQRRLSLPAIGRRHGDVQIVGIGRLLASVEKTWSKTIQGASKVFIGRNSNHHVRLISDAI